ncbi:helix-turn-helix domain-containing protein [Candidatus Enterococcus ferrettii]|uniref:Helicase Helix-turn-helix domain-containing protein n=1 Tax=Candidatus Enterococcus ferrettii TaxID=2815324 RepID=A0ABV0EWC9_9ENTE|nr:helix-turn-helix domain-containing protein [Enterococcus sp. 665A]MBO1342129.1 helix-turn-helix domain-containing protein [Enterococcus sp. 665A]
MTDFILALFHTGHKLRISTLYHLLIGKRTSSVLLHGFFYRNLSFFDSFSELDEKQFNQLVDQLIRKKMIEQIEGFGQLTEAGQLQLQTSKVTQLVDLNGLRYGRERERMWQLSLLGVQVASYLTYQKNEYIPLDSRPSFLYQTKKWVRQSGKDFLIAFPRELQHIFASLNKYQANFLANQFSGHEQFGRVAFQLLPAEWQEVPWDRLYYQNAIDAFLHQALQQPNFRRLLKQLDQLNYNQSMLKTRNLYLRGLSIEEIGKQRNLKQGTLNDHFIEWALMAEDFPFSDFQLIAPASESEMLMWRYQEFAEIPYLNFRLSQILFLKEQDYERKTAAD